MVNEFSIKLTYRKLEGLHELHKALWVTWKPKAADDYAILLGAHLRAITGKLLELMSKDQKKYTLKLDEVESLAMCQIWAGVKLDGVPEHDQVALQDVLNAIDKHRKDQQPKRYGTARGN